MAKLNVSLDASVINDKAKFLKVYITPESSCSEIIRRILSKWSSAPSKKPNEFELWLVSNGKSMRLENESLYYNLATLVKEVSHFFTGILSPFFPEASTENTTATYRALLYTCKIALCNLLSFLCSTLFHTQIIS